MRIIGYILLIFGFLWLALGVALPLDGPLVRGVGLRNFDKYPEASTFSGAEVQEAIRIVLLEYRDETPGVMWPAAVMLAGGVLLDVAGRRTAGRKVLKDEKDKPST